MKSDKINEVIQFALTNILLGLIFQSNVIGFLVSLYFASINLLRKDDNKTSFFQYQLQYLLPLCCILSLIGTETVEPTLPPVTTSTIQVIHRDHKPR